MSLRHEFVCRREESLLLVIDMQEAMLKVVSGWQETTRRIQQLIRAAKLLEIPVAATEQYPKGLGGTISELSGELDGAPIFHKEHFSACLEDGFIPMIRGFGRAQVVVAGMETHVCVLQTALDLIRAGFQVHLVKNAAASRFSEDWQTAVELLKQAGAIITTAEIVIFQWAGRSNTETFRKLLPIVK
jgi:nicotinamidase-related amidase